MDVVCITWIIRRKNRLVKSERETVNRQHPGVNGFWLCSLQGLLAEKSRTYRGCACLRRHGYDVYLYGGVRPVRGGRGQDRKEGASKAARVGLQPGSGRGQRHRKWAWRVQEEGEAPKFIPREYTRKHQYHQEKVPGSLKESKKHMQASHISSSWDSTLKVMQSSRRQNEKTSKSE